MQRFSLSSTISSPRKESPPPSRSSWFLGNASRPIRQNQILDWPMTKKTPTRTSTRPESDSRLVQELLQDDLLDLRMALRLARTVAGVPWAGRFTLEPLRWAPARYWPVSASHWRRLLVTLTRREREREEDGFSESSIGFHFLTQILPLAALSPFFSITSLLRKKSRGLNRWRRRVVVWTKNKENKCEGKIGFFHLTKNLKMTKV